MERNKDNYKDFLALHTNVMGQELEILAGDRKTYHHCNKH